MQVSRGSIGVWALLVLLAMAGSALSQPLASPFRRPRERGELLVLDRRASVAARSAAAEGLLRDDTGEEVLVQVLQDRQEPDQLRIAALKALVHGRTGPGPRYTEAAVAAITGAADSDTPPLHFEAIRALGWLGRMGMAGVAAPLRRAFTTGDAETRDAAARALGNMKGVEALPDFRAALLGPAPADAVWEAVRLIGAPAVPLLVELARSGPPRRERAISVLRSIGLGAKAAVPALRQLAKGGNRSAREALEDIGPTLAELIAKLDEPGAGRMDVLADMSRAAHAMGAEAAELVPPLRRALADPNARVRSFAAQALLNVGAPAREAFADLHRMLRTDDDVSVRCTAALAIREMATSLRERALLLRARAALDGARHDPHPGVRACSEEEWGYVSNVTMQVERGW